MIAELLSSRALGRARIFHQDGSNAGAGRLFVRDGGAKT